MGIILKMLIMSGFRRLFQKKGILRWCPRTKKPCPSQMMLNALNAGIRRHIIGLFRHGQEMSLKPSFYDAPSASTLGVITAKMIEVIPSGILKVVVKPGRGKNEIISRENGLLIVAIKEPAEHNKANLELVRFLSKETGRQVRIKSGFSSRRKTLVC